MDGVSRGRSGLIVAVLTISTLTRFTVSGLVAAVLVDLSKEFGTTVAAAGQLAAAWAMTWAILAPAVGPFSDRIGRKRMVVIGLVVCAAASLGYSASRDFSALLGFSILFGCGGAISGPNTVASVGDYYSPATRGRMMAIVEAGMPIAMLGTVPAGALIAGTLGWRFSFLVLGIFILVVALAAVIVLPPTPARQPGRRIAYVLSFGEAFREKAFLPLLLSNIWLQAAYWAIGTYLAAFLIQSYSLSTEQLAPFLSLLAIGHLAGTLTGGVLSDRLSRIKLCAVTQGLAGLVSIALMLLTPNIWLSVLLGSLFMGLYGSNRPAFSSLMVSVSSTVRGTVMGVQATSNHLGNSLGAMLGGLLLGLTGYGYLGVLCFVLSLFASAGFFRVSSLLHRMPSGATEGLT